MFRRRKINAWRDDYGEPNSSEEEFEDWKESDFEYFSAKENERRNYERNMNHSQYPDSFGRDEPQRRSLGGRNQQGAQRSPSLPYFPIAECNQPRRQTGAEEGYQQRRRINQQHQHPSRGRSPFQHRECHQQYFGGYCRYGRSDEENISDSAYEENASDTVNSKILIDILVRKQNCQASLLMLLENHNLKVSSVRRVVSENPNIFRIVGEVVELKINIKVCSAHNGDKGCANRSVCKDLHICSKYAVNHCNKRDCIMGHNWLTNHNVSILKDYEIQELPRVTIEKILRSSLVTSRSHGQLNVCYDYNKGKCQRQYCYNLHVCFDFVTGHSKCSQSKCHLNHNIQTPDCCKLLEASGIDVNESPRDILVALLEANPSLRKKEREHVKSPSLPDLRHNREERDDSKGKTPENPNPVSTGKKAKRNKPQKVRTVWYHFPNGNIEIPEICYDSVESVCANESNGCKRLHAIEHFHWQVSENGNTWINLQHHQVLSLERSFCDVNSDECKLPRVDPSHHQSSPSHLLSLLGRDSWMADFKTMKITDSKKSKTVLIRRLCTEIVSGNKVKPSSYIWYFLDKQQNWIEYGKVDSLGEANLISSLTSHDIEKQFLQDSSTPLTFQNSEFSYTLDFKAMTQINLNTNVVREVRRRPEVHLEEDKEIDEGPLKSVPPEWEKMKPNERLKRVVISSASEEYSKAVQLLGNHIAQGNIVSLERIQNLFHWYAFQNKIEEMTSIYGDKSKVNVRYLFHGTNHDVVTKICSENFDPRLHGLSAGQAYGQGTYFARDANLSYRYCKADNNGLKYLFVAEVVVGSFVLGNSSMPRPPINPNTGAPFESTVDNVTNPSIIVKYDKAEYYPKYIFTLR